MSRSREIKPRFFLDEEIAEVSRDARLLFIGLWTLADCEGRMEDRPARIKVQLFPYDADMTPERVDDLLVELEFATGDFLRRYEVDGRRYLWLRTLRKNQHIHPKEKPAGYPDPPVAKTLTGKILGQPGKFPASRVRNAQSESSEFAGDFDADCCDWGDSDRDCCFGDFPEEDTEARKIPGKPHLSPADPSVPSVPSVPSEPSGSICPETAEAGRSRQEQRELIQEPALLAFPCDGPEREWALTGSQVSTWEMSFPSLDILALCREALAWVDANPSKRKTHGGMKKFLVGWFSRAQNSGNGRRHQQQTHRRPGEPSQVKWPRLGQ